MNPDKKWKRYTRVGDIYVNLTKYRENLEPDKNGCLLWRGPLHRQGYSFIGILNQAGERKMTVGHRVAMRLKLNREIASDEEVKHACSNPACLNPAHLYLKPKDSENGPIEITTLPKIPTFSK
jgi:hypothetical protein